MSANDPILPLSYYQSWLQLGWRKKSYHRHVSQHRNRSAGQSFSNICSSKSPLRTAACALPPSAIGAALRLRVYRRPSIRVPTRNGRETSTAAKPRHQTDISQEEAHLNDGVPCMHCHSLQVTSSSTDPCDKCRYLWDEVRAPTEERDAEFIQAAKTARESTEGSSAG